MKLGRLGLWLALLGLSKSAWAQVPVAPAPAPEPAPALAAPSAPNAAEAPPAATAPEPAPDQPSPAAEAPPEAAPTPVPDSPPASPPPPNPAPQPEAPRPPPVAAPTLPPPLPQAWERAHSPLTLEGRLGLLLRPESSGGFNDETHAGAELGLSLYMDLNREFAAGLEIDRSSLGRGTALSGLDSVSIDYTVSSAMLGVRAYPKRTELFDLFVGLQVGLGVQGVSAQGIANNGALQPGPPYSCGASDAPAFQIGGGVGARLMLSPRWGVTARINGMGRRLSGEVIEDCVQGIGTATTVTSSIGLGYDFDLDPSR